MVTVVVPDRECFFGSGCHKGMDIGLEGRLKEAVGNISGGQGLYQEVISLENGGV